MSGASVPSPSAAAAAAAVGLPPPLVRGRTTRRAFGRSVCGSHGSAASGTGGAPGVHSASSSSSSSRSRCPHTKHVNTSRLTSSGASTCTRSSPRGVATTTVSGAPGDGARGGTAGDPGALLPSGGDAPVRLWCAMSSCGVCGVCGQKYQLSVGRRGQGGQTRRWPGVLVAGWLVLAVVDTLTRSHLAGCAGSIVRGVGVLRAERRGESSQRSGKNKKHTKGQTWQATNKKWRRAHLQKLCSAHALCLLSCVCASQTSLPKALYVCAPSPSLSSAIRCLLQPLAQNTKRQFFPSFSTVLLLLL